MEESIGKTETLGVSKRLSELLEAAQKQLLHGTAGALHAAGVADVVVIDHDPRLAGVLPRTVKVEQDADGYSQVVEV